MYAAENQGINQLSGAWLSGASGPVGPSWHADPSTWPGQLSDSTGVTISNHYPFSRQAVGPGGEDPFWGSGGGRDKRNKHKRTKHKRHRHKRTKHKRTRHDRTKHKRTRHDRTKDKHTRHDRTKEKRIRHKRTRHKRTRHKRTRQRGGLQPLTNLYRSFQSGVTRAHNRYLGLPNPPNLNPYATVQPISLRPN